MKPHKLEDQIKKALENREIAPRPESWDRLNAMLTANESKPVRKIFPYWNIAAAVAVFIGLFSFYLFQSEEITDVALPEKQVVSSENPNAAASVSDDTATNEITNQNTTQNPSFNPSINQKIKSINQESKAVTAVPAQTATAQTTAQNSNSALAENQLQKQQNTQEQLVAAVTDEARVETLSEKLKKRSRFKTNPDALLQAASQENERQYQNQMLAAVVKKFNEVKVVVQNRNTIK